MEPQKYSATYGKGARWITIVYAGCFIFLGGFALSGIKGTAGLGIVAGVILVIGLVTFYYSVKFYKINTDGILICRIAGEKLIQRKDILEIKVLAADDLKGTMRTMGVGGLFGYYGKFNNNKFGDMTWYMTNRQNLIGIFLKDKQTIIISPDDAEGFYKNWIASST